MYYLTIINRTGCKYPLTDIVASNGFSICRIETKKICLSMSVYQKWLEIKLLAGDFVSSAARSRIVLTDLIRTSQSLRAKEHYSPAV